MTDVGKTRGANRFLAPLSGLLHTQDGDHASLVHDLSRKGALLSGEFPLPAESGIEVTLRAPGGELQVRLKALVVRRQPAVAPKPAELAVDFHDVEAPQQAILEQLVSRVMEGLVPAVLAALGPGATVDEIRAALNRVPLAHRITLAGRGVVSERGMLIHDTNPAVLDALGRNPNLNLPEVQKLMRLPTLLPHTLEALARSKWGANEEVRVVIASHANTPLPLATRLINAMSPATRQRVLQRPGLSSTLRAMLLKGVGRT